MLSAVMFVYIIGQMIACLTLPDTRRALHFARQVMNFARCEGRLPIGGHLLFILHHGCPIDNFLENLVVDCVLSDFNL